MKILRTNIYKYSLLSIWVLFLFLFGLFFKMYSKYNPNKDNVLLNLCEEVTNKLDETYEINNSYEESILFARSEFDNYYHTLIDLANNDHQHYDYYSTVMDLVDLFVEAKNDDYSVESIAYIYNACHRISLAYSTFNAFWVVSLIMFIPSFIAWIPFEWVYVKDLLENKKKEKAIL